ncbi:hypothetical protein F0562_005790 [Nyssa sinensis]|uniref:Uncharacterized protein n=1 Tax=Nyssa sinensis TaxID=561372 RepID=A0A5J5APU0_9ASTE|nr:hypothetical protein F0562_005790 [Nyssa sinensis]
MNPTSPSLTMKNNTAVADPPYHGDGLPPLTRLEESLPPSPTSALPGSVTLPACRFLTAGVVLDHWVDRLGPSSDCARFGVIDYGAITFVLDLSANNEKQSRCAQVYEGEVGEDEADDTK